MAGEGPAVIEAPAYLASCTEKQFQRLVVEAAERFGWLCVHFPNMFANPIGFPDLILLRKGVCVFAELKAEKGTVGRKQKEWHDELAAAGFWVRVWRPSDWDDLVDELAGGGGS